jgi:hypothetical protein
MAGQVVKTLSPDIVDDSPDIDPEIGTVGALNVDLSPATPRLIVRR